MNRWRPLRSLSSLILALLPVAAGAQAQEAASLWQPVRASDLTALSTGQRVLLVPPRTLRLDQDGFRALLDRTPMEGTVAAEDGETVLEVPLPDGGFGRFRIEESPIMAADLAARFPEIRTFRGHGIDDPTATVRFDWTPAGFHAMVLSAKGTFLIDPYAEGDTAHYVTYHKKDYRRRDATPFRCLVKGTEIDEAALREELARAFGSPITGGSFGDQLRTYRLALATTAEYTAFFGSQGAAFAGMATTLNRVNGIYEREVAVHVNLVTGTEIVYTGTDPYTNNDGLAMLCQNQCNLDSVIGSGNYDIGHVFSTGGGGVAGIQSVCDGSTNTSPFCSCPGIKAFGVTGLPSPTGDVFAVDFVAHEMGHQFGANHTFNGTTGNCGGNNRNASTAYEPGSGSTIMAYSGICGSQNVQINADDYFHAASLQEINSFITNAGNACAATSGSNNPPAVIAPTSFTIPKQTPFTLTATSATDPNGDTVTLGWEEFDLGAASPPDNDISAVRPIFRSFDPSTSPSRTFPSLPNILNGTNAGPFEVLPTRSRTMAFRVTARDNHSGQGATSFVTTNVVVSGTSGPFAVTSPNTNVNWGAGTTQTVTWSVNNSNVISANVKISLSTDGGQTFPTVLLATTPNDGSETVTVPSVFTTTARVKVEAVTSIFFDISNTNFSIAPGISVSDATPVTEGNAGTTTATFTVSLLQTSSQQIKVNYATANGTAAAGTDYVSTAGTLTFNPGDLTKNVDVTVNGDTLFEVNETFVLNLSNPINAVIADSQGTGTILNDDTAPTVSINDVSIAEGNSGTKNASFTVSLSTLSGATTTVDYTTADGTTTAGSDYVAVVGATLSIPAGNPSGALNIVIKGDTVTEPDETFFVNLSNPGNATILDGQGQGTILNDDVPGVFQFSLANYTVSEALASATIKVTRTSGTAAGATVEYETSDGTATGTPGPDQDYVPTFGTLIFAANRTSLTFKVTIVRDTRDEPNETVLFRLHNPQPAAEGAALGVQRTAVLTINDNDKPGTIKLSSASYSVGEAGPTATITVRRSGGLASPVTVDYTAAPGTASDPGDFTTAVGTLTFGPSGAAATTQTFTVPIGPNDGVAEGAETVLLTLSAPGGGAVLGSPSSGVLTIVDDEPTVWFSAASYSAKETAAGALVTVKRSGPLTSILNVDYLASDAGATVNEDYKPTAGTLTFSPNVSTRTFIVGLLKDTLVEGAESVALTLSNPTPGTSLGTAPGSVTPGAASLTILDDDATPTVQFSAATYTVSEASPKAIVTVKRTGSLGGTVTVDYAATDVTTTNGPTGDYDLPPGTLTFLPGKTVQTITVPIVSDTFDEGTETALLTLTNQTWTDGTAAIGGTNPATLRITDNEPTVQFTAASYKVSEAAIKATILVRRTGVLSAPASVDYQVTGGTATNGVDYNLASACIAPTFCTLTFNAGAATTPLVIPLTMDNVDEPNETVTLVLSNPSPGIELGTPEMTTLTITDNDVAGKVQFSVANYSVSEDGGTVNLTVNRTLGTSELATIDFDVTGGTATNSPAADFDYTLAAGTLTFNPGVKSMPITVAITEDASVEGNESVIVTLSNPGGGLSIGTIPQATLWIVDND